MNTDDFDYELPKSQIARYPLANRCESRLLTLSRATGDVVDAQFSTISSLLKPGDCLVLNDTRVIPARWFGKKQTGGEIECLIERVTAAAPYPRALVHLRASKTPKEGSLLVFQGDITATVLAKTASGLYELQWNTKSELFDLLERFGEIPLPPYLERVAEDADRERYQTVYAKHPGAVAAPTAGLHFDEKSLAAISSLGVSLTTLTLHVGAGTFQPVRVDRIEDHQMHAETFSINEQACAIINQTRAQGGRVIAVGTTVVRTLETVATMLGKDAPLVPTQGESRLFISPGYDFKMVDAILTNFHLPRSSLLMLVCAFAGHPPVINAYRHAVEAGYRFFSYGDAMFIS